MAKPFALYAYNPVFYTVPRFLIKPLSNVAKGWKRSIRSNGGCWQGSFYATADSRSTTKGLQGIFETWLGYHVLEKSGGMDTWSGLIYEMDYTSDGFTRRRTLDLMANRVQTTYLTLDYTGENFCRNNSFENYTAVGAPMDDFWSWTEAAGTNGTVLRATPGSSGGLGTSCVALNNDTDDGTVPDFTYIRQNIEVTPGAKYLLTFWTRGDGVAGGWGTGRWGIRDPNAGIWLHLRTTYYTSATWKQITTTFSGPSDGEIVLFFIAPVSTDPSVGAHVDRTAYFDEVSILEQAPCVYDTEWATTPESIARYGVKEEIIHLDGYPEPTSRAYRDTYLAEHGWPWPRPVTISKPGEVRLDVFVAGYVHTMNWLYVQTGDGTAHDLDDWLALIAGSQFGIDPVHGGDTIGAGDCQFVKTGNIKPNTLQVPQIPNVEERPWDVISELIDLGDANGDPWRAWVDPARLLHYVRIDPAPRYYVHKDGVHDTMAGHSPVNPWMMQPAVVRDMTYRSSLAEPGSFLDSAQDAYIEEVEMADGWDRPALKTVMFSEAELLMQRAERGL